MHDGIATQAIHPSPFAGRWYPADASELRDLIAEVFNKSAIRTGGFVRRGGIGFVVPHAAPMYSGTVAAACYRHIEENRPRRIVLLGFSHRRGVEGVAIPEIEAISTPLGTVELDRETGRALTARAPFHHSPEQRLCDHSSEIQLPFLQTVAPEAKVLLLYVGRLDRNSRREAAVRLRELLDDETVLVASSDLTHYGEDFGYTPFPPDEEASENLRTLDGNVISAAGSLAPEIFLDELEETGSTVCGSAPIALLLETLRAINGQEMFQESLDYTTSAEITGDRESSVSYGALGYFPYSSFLLGAAAGQELLDIAQRSIDQLRETGKRPSTAITPQSVELTQRLGAFVTVYQRGELRGCIGRCYEPESLAHSVPHLALSAALEDERFEPLRRSEPVDVEVSVLSPFKRIRDPGDLIVGEHGALLERNRRAGLLLPKVAEERDWDRAQFLRALAKKAGLSPDVYRERGAHLSIFRAQVIKHETGTANPGRSAG